MKPTVKIAHIADVHLRAAQYGSLLRGEDFYTGVCNACSAAKEHGADIIVCAGDLLDSNNPGPRVVVDYVRGLHEELERLDIPMLVTVGNHDNCNPSWLTPYLWDGTASLQAGINFITGDGGPFGNGLYFIDLGRKDTFVFSIQVFDFMGPQAMRSAIANAADSTAIAVWHGEIREFCGYPKEEAICFDDFLLNKFKLLLMGDQHIHEMRVREEDKFTIAYPGSTEMCSESEDECKRLFIHTITQTSDNVIFNHEDTISVRFDTKPVLRCTVQTEEELQETEQDLKRYGDVLAYVRYNRYIPDVVSRLHAAVSKSSCLRLTPMMANRFKVEAMSRETVIKGPAEFFDANQEKFIQDAETRARVSGLCKQLLTLGEDHKERVNTFCSEYLGTITT